MSLDILRAELERLFELEELLSLTRDVMGFDPEQVGGTSAKGSFALALTKLCLESDAVEALCDAVLASKDHVNPAILQLRLSGPSDDRELQAGESLGAFTVVRKLGEGRLGASYLVKKDGREIRLKVLRREATRDRGALQRFLTVSRLVGRIEHPGLPSEAEAARVGEFFFVAHRYVDGQSLSARIARTGAMHINEARALVQGILEPLKALHERRISHGDLRAENILIARGVAGQPQPLLLDAGSDRLRARARPDNGQTEFFSTVGSPHTVAPEQIHGLPSDPRSDVYSFGALLYEVLVGKPVFSVSTPIEAALSHLSAEPPAASRVAPRGWISPELDDLILSLLAKDPADRPGSASAVLETLASLERGASQRTRAPISESELNDRIDALIADPGDMEAVLRLESAGEEGAPPERVAEAFSIAAEGLGEELDAEQKEAAKELLFRAARLYADFAKDPERAEQTYLAIQRLDPTDEVSATALEQIRKKLGKFEDVIEMLLARSERAESDSERARALFQIGKLYADELEDREQAVVAFSQALTEDPRTEYAEQIERVAGTNQQIWGEVLSACAQALGNEQLSLEVRNQLMLRVGRWYLEKVVRPDLALPCFHSVIAADPANGEALSGLAHIYRRAQQWKELVGILSRWADAAKTPAHARDLRAESADLMAQRLNDVNGARDLYERIVQEDPGHASACEALGKIYQSTRNVEGYAKLLERRAEALRGEEKLRVLCQLGEVYEDHLKDDSEAVRCYRRALSIEPKHLDALRALDRVYSRTARYQDLLENIRAQIEVAATPRQKIALFERIAGIYDEEFLDHQQAAQAWEEVLRFDSAHQPALTALIRHYRALDRWEEVGSVYARLLKLVTDPGHRVELAIACGRVFAEQLNSPERAEAAYEMVLQVDPEHGGALEALARLRETAGDADAALKAIEALAVRAATPEAKAEQLVRAAKLFEARRDLDSAIERYKRALDASPKQLSIATALREAYVARGDINAAVKLIGWEIDQTEGDRAKGKLAGEMAVLLYSRLQDAKRAEEAGRRAVALDPTNVGGRTVLGDVSFDAQKFLEAAVNYEVVADRADSLPKEEATRVLVRYVDALSQSGSSDKALAPVATLLRIAPEDIKALEHVARVTYEHGAPKRAAELYKELLARASSLSDSDRGVALYRRGESLRRSGDAKDAIEPLEEASDLDPSSAEPLISLAKAFEELGRWDQVVKVKNRHMDLAQGETRVQLLMEIGDIYASKLKDRTQATKSYVIALDERPEDRRLLAKLMQLYSEEKDWNRLIEVVVRLASFVEDPVQKVKYLHTAANLSAKQMNDPERAMDFYNQVLELDPDMDRALTEAIELEQGRNNHAGVEKLLQRQIELAKRRTDEKLQLSTFTALGQLYEKLGSTDKAIDAYEAAQALDADNRERALQLSEIYASDPTRYLDKAVASQALILRQNPYRRESYKMLRRLYTETKRADAAWCLCQALHVLKLADPDEERFYTRMRADTSAEAQDVMNDADWVALIHADADPLLTSLFALIEPIIIQKRGSTLDDLGYDSSHVIDCANHASILCQSLAYSASVFGMTMPPAYENTNDPGGLLFLHAHEPSVVLGVAALGAQLGSQPATFIAARHLAYLRPSLYTRQLIPTIAGLKAWLFASVKLIAPQFPIAAELEGPVREALEALDRGLAGHSRDHLARVVAKLVQSGASLDLKKWIAGVDFTADRAGFVLCHDLEISLELIKASEEGSTAASNQERNKELVLFSVSEPYFALRKKLGVAID